MTWRVPLSDLDYGDEEEQAVLDVLRSRWLTMGAVTNEFEGTFAKYLDVNFAFGVTNATAALHLACLALGIGSGDEVIVPSLTFVATANAVLYTGAEVIFADIVSSQNLTISPEDILKRITPRTKAIMVMHYGGYPCHMPEIMQIASEHRLAVIEDAAHAPGAALDGKPAGTWGDAGCFSFFSNKNLPVGEGGMLVTNREDIAEKVRLLRSHGMTSLTLDRHLGHAYSYDVIDQGFNYRIDELRSALGLVQLSKLDKNNLRRKRIVEKYRTELQDIPIEIPFREHEGEPAHHIFPILLPRGFDRKQFMDGMRHQGVQTSIHYPPVHTFRYYMGRYGSISLPETEAVAEREITLPIYPSMGDAEMTTVIEATKFSLRELEFESEK